MLFIVPPNTSILAILWYTAQLPVSHRRRTTKHPSELDAAHPLPRYTAHRLAPFGRPSISGSVASCIPPTMMAHCSSAPSIGRPSISESVAPSYHPPSLPRFLAHRPVSYRQPSIASYGTPLIAQQRTQRWDTWSVSGVARTSTTASQRSHGTLPIALCTLVAL